jgi:L-aminopeptidase/D-esterase-like protein
MVLPEGFRVGHWTDVEAATGCTVILCPPRTVCSCDIRGSSPGSRELALLAPDKTMQEVHAILLTGGSAFGLAAADGVMQYLEQENVGYQTPWVRVPIVPAAVIFDLNVGSRTTRPTAESGYAACRTASSVDIDRGSVGAGTGATVGKWAGTDHWMKGGFGMATRTAGKAAVCALAVVNAVGDVLDAAMNVLAGARSAVGQWLVEEHPQRELMRPGPSELTNTTLVAVLTNAALTKVEAHRVAQRTHDGFARAVKPAHTSFDGDVAFVCATGGSTTPFDIVAECAADAAADAIRDAVRSAAPVAGVPAVRTIG